MLADTSLLAQAPREGGLEAHSATGRWVDNGRRGGGLQVTGMEQRDLDTCIREVKNPLVGMAWTDREGKLRGKVDIFAFREMARRIRNFIHEDPEALVMMHHSNQVAIPILSFMDLHMNGEHFNTGPHQVQGRNYIDVMPPATMRACYMLHQWGVVPSFLPEHPQSTRSMMGYFWVHDAPLYNAWCDHHQFNRAVRVKQSFGLEDVEFLGYWTPQAPALEPVDPDRCRIFVSAYRKPRGEILLFVANMNENDQTVRIRLNPKSLRLACAGRTLTGKDMEYGQEFEISDGILTLPILRQDFRMITGSTQSAQAVLWGKPPNSGCPPAHAVQASGFLAGRALPGGVRRGRHPRSTCQHQPRSSAGRGRYRRQTLFPATTQPPCYRPAAISSSALPRRH